MSEGKKVLVANVKMLGVAQNMVECDVDVEGANIAKILSVQSVPRIVSTEILENEVNYEGIAFIKMFVLCQDGSVKALSSQHKFSGKLENNAISVTSRIFANSKSVDCIVTTVSERGAKVVCSIETAFTLIGNAEIPIMPFDDEKLEIKEKELSTWVVVDCKTTDFETTGEIFIPGDDVKIVLVENSLVIKSSTMFSEYGVVKGEITTRLLFVYGDNNTLQSATTITPFSQEIEINAATTNGILQSNVALCDEKFKLLLSQEKKQARATLEFTICLSTSAYEQLNNNVIEDAYSITHESKCVVSEFEQSIPGGDLYFERKVEGNFVLEDTHPKVKKLLAVSGASIGAVETNVKDNKITLIGVAYANLIYEEEKEEIEETEENAEKANIFSPTSVQIEIPFEIFEEYRDDATIISFNVMIDDVDVSVKKGKNVFFDAKVKAYFAFGKYDTNSCITSVGILQPRKEKEDGIEIVFAKKGDSLWDISKKLGVSANQLLSQNPNIADPLEKNERIVLYFQYEEK